MFGSFKHYRHDSALPLLFPGKPLVMFPFCILSYMMVLLDKYPISSICDLLNSTDPVEEGRPSGSSHILQIHTYRQLQLLFFALKLRLAYFTPKIKTLVSVHSELCDNVSGYRSWRGFILMGYNLHHIRQDRCSKIIWRGGRHFLPARG